MAVTSTSASLSLYGRTTADTAARVTAVLRIEPTILQEAGDPHPSPALAAQGKLAARSHWGYDEPPTRATDDDPHGIASLDRLAERFGDLEPEFLLLREHYDIRVWMVGTASSQQGGFAVGAVTMGRLGRMHAAFFPTVWLDEPHD